VWGSTEIDVVQKSEEVQILLHAQQMSIDSIALISSEGAEKDEAGKAGKGEEVPVKYTYREPKQVVPDGDAASKEVRDIHNFTLKYKSLLAQSDAGELLIFIPVFGVKSHKVPNNHPAKDEASDSPWTMWKVKIKFTLQRPKGGLVFAGGVAGDVAAHMFTDGQCGGPRTWFPCWDALDAANTFEIIVTVPKGNTVLCSAPLLTQKAKKAKDSRGSIDRFQFKTKSNGMIPARCIALAVGPFVQLPDPGMSQRVSHWCVPHSNAEQRLAFSTQFVSRSLEILRWLLSGHELPCETLHLVFVSNPPDDIESYPGLLIASSSLLYDASIISQSFETVGVLVRGLVGQWFGLNGTVRPESRQDTWLVHGIAGYLTHMCLKRFYGNNDYMFKIMVETEWVCEHDSLTVAALCSEAPAHPIEHSTELRMRKAALVVRLIEKRIGEANMKKVLAQLLSKASKTADGPVLGTKNLFKMIKKCSGLDIAPVMHHWILGSGCAIMTANFKLNKKRGQIEFAMRINNEQLRARNKQDQLTIRVHETEVTYHRAVKVEGDEFIVDEFAPQSRWKRTKRDKEADCEGQHELIADIIQENDNPLQWMRVDPEVLWIRKVELQQADYMWVYQLFKDRHVVAQVEAMEGLCKGLLAPQPDAEGAIPLVLDSTRQKCCRVLQETLENPQIYYAVRGRAAKILGRLCLLRSEEDQDGVRQLHRHWVGCPLLLQCARRLFVDQETQLPLPNRFHDLDGYLLRLEVIDALATCREEARVQAAGAPATNEVYKLLHDLLEYNDNSQNGAYSDSDYVAALLVALGRACSSNADEVDETRRQMERYLQREQLMPSYAHRVTCAALRALQMLQYRRLVPLDLQIFLRHAKVGQSTEVRCAAVQCLAGMSALQPALLLPLLRLLALEQVARVRHALLNAMLDSAAALIRKRKVLDAPTEENIAVVNALWSFLNQGSAYDVRSRFLAASLYTLMVGEGHPQCMLRDERYALRLSALPSERELESLRYDAKKQSLKVTLPRASDLRKGKTAAGGRGDSACKSSKSKLSAMRSEAKPAAAKMGSPKPSTLSADELFAKQQEERERRARERQRTQSVQVSCVLVCRRFLAKKLCGLLSVCGACRVPCLPCAVGVLCLARWWPAGGQAVQVTCKVTCKHRRGMCRPCLSRRRWCPPPPRWCSTGRRARTRSRPNTSRSHSHTQSSRRGVAQRLSPKRVGVENIDELPCPTRQLKELVAVQPKPPTPPSNLRQLLMVRMGRWLLVRREEQEAVTKRHGSLCMPSTVSLLFRVRLQG